jgi:hypothetical protein
MVCLHLYWALKVDADDVRPPHARLQVFCGSALFFTTVGSVYSW